MLAHLCPGQPQACGQPSSRGRGAVCPCPSRLLRDQTHVKPPPQAGGAHAALLQTARLSGCPHTTRPRPWPFVTGCQLGHTVYVPPKPSSSTTAFPGPTRGQGRRACSPGLGTPVLPAEQVWRQRVGKRLCAEPAHSPRGLAGLGGLHCLSVQAPPAKQKDVGRAPRGDAPRAGKPPAPSPPAGPSLTTGPGSPRSPGKPRSPGGPSFPGRPAGPGSP